MAEFKCDKCDKEFTSKEALEMHNNSKHYVQKREPINKKKAKKWMIFLVIGIVIVGGGYGLTLWNDRPGEYDDFAQCLTDSGAKEFGAYWCPNCAEQKKLFGRSFKNVNYIECSLPNRAGQTQECIDEGIQAYPTWEFSDGTRIEGLLPLERLAAESGCEL